jgi:anti-anti-sigma factor
MMRDEPLTIQTFPGSHAGSVVLRLQGPLTIGTLFGLQDTVRAQTAPRIILDLSGVPYMDSAGLGVLLTCKVSAEKNNRQLRLAGVSERVMSLIRMTRVDTILNIYPTVADAEQNFSG